MISYRFVVIVKPVVRSSDIPFAASEMKIFLGRRVYSILLSNSVQCAQEDYRIPVRYDNSAFSRRLRNAEMISLHYIEILATGFSAVINESNQIYFGYSLCA